MGPQDKTTTQSHGTVTGQGIQSIDYSMSQLPCFPDQVSDEAGAVSDKWLYVDPEYPEACSP